MKVFIVHYDLPEFYTIPLVSKIMKKYNYVARAFGFELRVVDTKGWFLSNCGGSYLAYSNLLEALEGLNNLSIVMLEPESYFIKKGIKPMSLKNFKHPKDCVYIIGPDYGGTDTSFLNKDIYYVRIDTKNDVPLWASTVMGIVAYDCSE